MSQYLICTSNHKADNSTRYGKDVSTLLKLVKRQWDCRHHKGDQSARYYHGSHPGWNR